MTSSIGNQWRHQLTVDGRYATHKLIGWKCMNHVFFMWADSDKGNMVSFCYMHDTNLLKFTTIFWFQMKIESQLPQTPFSILLSAQKKGATQKSESQEDHAVFITAKQFTAEVNSYCLYFLHLFIAVLFLFFSFLPALFLCSYANPFLFIFLWFLCCYLTLYE